MKRFYKFLMATALVLCTALTAVSVTSCEDTPVDIVVTDYGYAITIDDIHMAEGVYPECLIRITSGGTRE